MNSYAPSTLNATAPAAEKQPYVMALCHQKGGVAKTTSSLALAACLADAGKEVLLIDLDPQGNLTAGVGLRPEDMRHSAADVLLGNNTVLQVSRETGFRGIDIVPANPDMLTVSRYLYLRPSFEHLLRDSLQHPNLAFYDYIIIDCPPALGPVTLNALTAAHLALIPTQCEFFSMQALNSIFKLINMVWSKTNPNLTYRILVTMFDRRTRLHARVLSQLRQKFPNALFDTIVGVDSKLRESQMAGQPITTYARNTRSARQYCALAEEVDDYARRQLQSTT